MVERAAAGTRRELVQRVMHSKLARAALVVLWLLYASAIYAPLIANDKPLYLRAIDRGACERALSTLEPLIEEWAGALVSCDSSDDDATFSARLAPSRSAVLARVALLREALPRGEVADELARFEAHMDAAVTAFQNGGLPGPGPDIAAMRESAARARREFDPSAARASSSAPLLASLSSVDVLAMLLALALPAFALARGLRRRVAPCVVGAVVLALAWPWLFAPSKLASVPYKTAIATGDLVVESALFPPLAFAVDETNSTEVLRPPTWLASSEIDAEGHYLRGPRRTSPDPVTGLMPASNPVRVLPREPERNSAWRHPLGTDSLGRDLLARLLWGGRTSLVVGAVAAALVILIGVALGSLAGWFGRWVDALLSRVIEVFASFPAVFVIVVAAALIPTRALDPRLSIPLVVGLIGWTSVARLVRGEVLRVKALDYVAAARVLGLSDARILARHVLPNAIQPVIVAGAFLIGWGIFVEAGVSFLGFGVELPTPSWGALLNDSRAGEHWWVQVFPGAAIAATVLAFHLLGEALRDALDPRAESAP